VSRLPRVAGRRTLAAVVWAALVAATLTTAGPAAAAPPPDVLGRGTAAAELPGGRYIVRFQQAPAATYIGGEPGYAATAPRQGARIDARSAAVQQYRGYLKSTQDGVLGHVGARAFYSYTLALNGAAVDLTAEQARELATSPEVRSLAPDELRMPTADVSADVPGLPRGIWPAAGGQKKAGSGVVVGVLDTGIWPENPSFAPNDTPVPEDWKGQCQTGEEFTAEHCNGKIIGARFYPEGFGPSRIAAEDYLSARDGDGHGSHTASTAAGNRVDDVVVDGNELGTLSGMAPGAKIAAYKVCWTGVDNDGCATSDSVQAVEDAIDDGVDVINYSIGSTTESSVVDGVELAFLNAAAAGVFVSAAAGNSGPGASTLDHPSPWVTTVAASTYKISEKALELGDGQRFVGASTTGPLPELTPMVLGASAPAAGASPDDARLCAPGRLDPARVTGRLVVCERGVVDRIAKSAAVKQAGGAGMVLVNPTANSVNGDLHLVPSVHLDVAAYGPVKGYVTGTPDAQGRIVELDKGESDTRVPEVAAFSSRGPSTTTGGDILKPDLSAPGVDVAAAVAPPFHFGRDYDLLSGTSMATPQVAGLAAVLMQVHPDWSPMAVKSALMTSTIDNVSTDSPFDEGAGFVQPKGALDPGIVFDHGVLQWLGYVEEAVGTDVFPGIEPLDGSQVNQASVGIGGLAGVETVTRTVTNVSGRSEGYRLRADVPGVDVAFSDRSFTLRKDESKTIDITLTRRDAAFDAFTTGHITFAGSKHTVRIPVAVRPVAAAVDPAEVRGSGASGTADVTVRPGFTGTMTASAAGLVGAVPQKDSVTGNPGAFDPAAPGDPDDSVDSRQVVVPAGTNLLRFSVDGPDDADLDLWVYRLAGGQQQPAGFSATGAAEEEVTLTDPAPGEYVAYVTGFAVRTSGEYAWTQWLVGGQAAGNLTVAPPSQPVSAGKDVRFTAGWTGLDPAQRYLGWLGFSDGTAPAARAVVSVG
jgi:subtilisin family serine protease